MIPASPGKPASEGGAALQGLARQIALDIDAWTSELAAVMTTLFDQLAPTWDAEHATNRLDALTDALQRGGALPSGICLEIGSGTGQHTATPAGAFEQVVAVDLAWQMRTRASARIGARVQADAARLPLTDASIAAIVCVDVLLFARGFTRVLGPGGLVIWIDQLGTDGPLFVDTPTVVAALGGAWTAVQSEAGWGSWAVLRRVPAATAPVMGNRRRSGPS
ncbi:class I SAM-dependent methyltransferase [Streptosporangium subroseum]|uniref:class I SAM-dependent methyltransferase n=1 Tax=Streptosporangium subroseum TaxID=106412 RepID=UPI00308F20E9|nr:class I SAM-dependent methyltransferase [Streptosporangium subroseum]